MVDDDTSSPPGWHYIFSRGFLQTFISHYQWEGGQPNIYLHDPAWKTMEDLCHMFLCSLCYCYLLVGDADEDLKDDGDDDAEQFAI